MRTFECACGNTVYFENTECLACGRALGYVPDASTLSALEPAGDGLWRALRVGGGGLYRMCPNYIVDQVCNWMLPAEDTERYCRSCRLNEIIPDLSLPENRPLWARIEAAKRRMLYTLFFLRLPVVSRRQDPRGLAFRFLADPISADSADPLGDWNRVMTGHDNGLITLNVAEADDVAREEMRHRMNEPYRTLLGHFRHEIGHYYWEVLVRDSDALPTFRELFGDERKDYAEAVREYYANGPARRQVAHVSAYAMMHPWEDWAETWAHYLHMVDTLETAEHLGFAVHGRRLRGPAVGAERSGWRFDDLFADWVSLTLAMNDFNRSMGLRDAYPFVVPAAAIEKLRFVGELIRRTGERAG
ncbi:MAG: hypothetical protein QOD06_3354 [Candidatus Binatota bacterium]|nr:hypothetical protein [Candidatus Binatota bacterium]